MVRVGYGGNVHFDSTWLAQKTQQKLKGKGILSSVADTGAELFISKGIPFLAKKALEAASYYVSEFMRDPELQKKQ